MFIKKIYNDVDTIVDEVREAQRIIAPPPYSREIPGTRIMVRKDEFKKPKGLVKLVGGGGSGHEGAPNPGRGFGPAPGSMDMMAAGDIFAAPAPAVLLRGIEEVYDGSDVFFNVANHAGDILNAKMAIQMAKMKHGWENIYWQAVGNDVTSGPKGTPPEERRGIGGSFGFSGIMAELGKDVGEIMRMNRKCAEFTRAIGVGIRPAIHPVTGLPIMPMPEEKIEIGIGVHGESAGVLIDLPRSKDLAAMLCDRLLDDLDYVRGEELVFGLNGLGGMAWTELYILFKDIYRYLEGKGAKFHNFRIGNGGTQELGGIILTISRLDDEIKEWEKARLPEGMYPGYK